jgi:hypothetical protein
MESRPLQHSRPLGGAQRPHSRSERKGSTSVCNGEGKEVERFCKFDWIPTRSATAPYCAALFVSILMYLSYGLCSI